MSIFVIGHKNPDTDAICSAIGYAHFLKRSGMMEAEAACCGEINARTQFALSTAGVEHPKLLMDVRPTLGQIARRDVITAREDEPLFTVYRRMLKNKVRALPVLARDGSLKGLISFARVFGTSVATLCVCTCATQNASPRSMTRLWMQQQADSPSSDSE